MGTIFNWFKGYKIESHRYIKDEYELTYLDGGNSSHSGYNIGICQDLLEKYGGKRIPSICEDWIKSEDEKLELINPDEMAMMCEKILNTSEVDDINMRERFEFYKQLSDEGYYLTYDYQ